MNKCLTYLELKDITGTSQLVDPKDANRLITGDQCVNYGCMIEIGTYNKRIITEEKAREHFELFGYMVFLFYLNFPNTFKVVPFSFNGDATYFDIEYNKTRLYFIPLLKIDNELIAVSELNIELIQNTSYTLDIYIIDALTFNMVSDIKFDDSDCSLLTINGEDGGITSFFIQNDNHYAEDVLKVTSKNIDINYDKTFEILIKFL